MQVRSGGQQRSSKDNQEVCESRNSCSLVGGQILLSCRKIQINFSKKSYSVIFWMVFLDSLCDSWSLPMMKVTDLAPLCKQENFSNEITGLNNIPVVS